MTKQDDLETIPGVGKSIAEDLRQLGYVSVADLKNRDPEMMYARSCAFAGMRIDPCLLYVYRCAVYFASNENPDPKLLKWWNWKDRKLTHG